MPRSRPALAGILLLLALALVVPAVSLAGGSAGDQQYTDPFAGGSGGGSSHSATATASASATTPAPSHTSSNPVASTTPVTPTSSAAPTTGAVQATTNEPTATIAGSSSPTLPYTGYDAWTATGFGVTLLAGGAVLRWRLRSGRS